MNFRTLTDVINSHKCNDTRGITFFKDQGGERFVSYQEIYNTSRRVLYNLQSSGVEPQNELVFQVYDNEYFVYLFWACIMGNIIPVPLTFAAKDDARDKIFNVWRVLDNPYLAIDRKSMAQFGPAYTDRINSIKENIFYVEDLLDLSEEGAIVQSGPEQIAFIQFSSGSTGAPKGVVLTHRNVLANTEVVLKTGGFNAEQIWLSWMPLTHDMGLIGFHIMPTAAGGMQYSMTPTQFIMDPMSWMEKAARYRATVLCSPNFGYKYFLDHYQEERAAPWDLSSVRLIFNGAEPISAQLCNAFLYKLRPYGLSRNSMFTVYGLAEATLAVSFPPVGAEFQAITLDRSAMGLGQPVRIVDQRHPQAFGVVNVGRALEGSPLRIVDNDDNPLDDGIIGNIQIKGPNVTGGYYNNPLKTREMINADGWLATEDLGVIVKDDLYVTGRAKEIIFVNGVNYYAHDIEAAAEEVPGLGFGKAIAVGVRNDSNSQDDIILFISYKETVYERFIDLADQVTEAVSAKTGLVVRTVVPISRIPRTTSGKPQRFRLREAFETGAYEGVLARIAAIRKDRTAVFSLPETDTEKAIANIWSKVFAVDIAVIGIHSTFLELGGDSLNAIEIAAKIQHECNRPVSVAELFTHPELRALAGHLDRDASPQNFVLRAPEAPLVPAADPLNRHQPFPLTEVQQAYWLGRSDLFDLGNVSTHIYLEIDVTDLDIKKFNRAVQKTIERHDMLKSVIRPDGTQQILQAVPPYEIEVEDLVQMPNKTERLRETRAAMSHEVLPLDTWPHFRIKASLLSADKTRIHISIDLVCIDGWSIRIFLNDIAAFYNNPQWAPPPLTLSFRDYISAFARSCLTTRYQLSEQYWRLRLPDLPAAPQLPVTRHSNAMQKPNFKRLEGRLAKPAWQRLKQTAMQLGLTPTSVLLCAFSEVLSTWSKKKHFSINVTLFNRPDTHPEMEAIIGDFTSSILLEVDCRRQISFSERAARVIRQLANDLEHRHVSGVTVIREMARKQGQAPNALMPVVFTSTLGYRTGDGKFTRLADIGKTVYAVSQTPQVWLDHQIFEEEGALVYNWDYVKALFPADMMEQMFAVYGRTLDLLSGNETPWDRIFGVEMLDHCFQKRAAANATKAPVSEELLHTLFLHQARKNPQKTAVITPVGKFSYHEILKGSKRVADCLKTHGVRKNSFVAVAMEKGWEQVVAVLGILFSGAAYLPIDPGLPEERRNYLITSAESKVVLVKEEGSAPFNPPSGVKSITMDSILSDSDIAKEDKLEEFEILQGVDDLAYMIFTSGSTGLPKGVMIDHRGAVNTILDINERFDINAKDRVLALSNLNFDLSVYDIFGTLAAGGAIVMPAPDKTRDPEHWADLLSAHNITVWNSVPALMQLLVDYAEQHDPFSLKSLRRVLLSGDWIPVELPERIKKSAQRAEVISLGGATEASIWSIFHPIETVEENMRSIPYGKPLGNQTFHVLDEHLQHRPDWVPGELYIGGIGLAKGYWKDDVKTQAHFITHPRTKERLYRTGDWGRYMADGSIEFLGREDLQVKINGHRIELGEIESILERHPQVGRAVADVVGPNKNQLVAYFAGHNDPSGNPEENDQSLPDEFHLKRYLEEKIPAYMVPKTYVILEKIPLTANGKVDRKALQAVLPDVKEKNDFVAPESSTELAVAKAWRQILQRDKVGLQDNFFDLGGDSLMAIQLHLNLKKTFKRDIPMAMLYKHTTIASMASYLSGGKDAEDENEMRDFEHAAALRKERLNRRTQKRELRRREFHG